MNTRVIKLGDDMELSYSIPPEMAVVAAYEQYEKRNWNTWTYPAPVDHPEFRTGMISLSCGGYSALVELKAYYLKPTGSTCYDPAGITYPEPLPVNWSSIFWKIVPRAVFCNQFGWSNQPQVLCFKAGDVQLKLIEKRLADAIPWILRPVIVECDFFPDG